LEREGNKLGKKQIGTLKELCSCLVAFLEESEKLAERLAEVEVEVVALSARLDNVEARLGVMQPQNTSNLKLASPAYYSEP